MNKQNIKKAIESFNSGEIVVFPTDTAYGIGCRIDFADSVEKIFKIRQRVESKPLLVLANNMEMVEEYVYLNSQVRQFAKEYWPGGVTLILPCKKDIVPSVVRAGGDTLAVRIPKHQELLEIIKEIGVPVVAPSANISGNKTPYKIEEVEKEILESADLVISGECTYKKESTIINTISDSWQVVRRGAVIVKNF